MSGDKWKENAEAAIGNRKPQGTIVEAVASALEAADRAAREECAKIAENVFPIGKLKSQNAAFCSGNIIAAAIRKGTQ